MFTKFYNTISSKLNVSLILIPLLQEKIKVYVATLVDLLGDPDLLLKRKAFLQNQKMFPTVELSNKDMNIELQQLQNRFIVIHFVEKIIQSVL